MSYDLGNDLANRSCYLNSCITIFSINALLWLLKVKVIALIYKQKYLFQKYLRH